MTGLEIIRNRWQQAQKVFGLANVLTVADGTMLSGRYVLCGSGSVTASHDALNGFCASIGFPTDANGGSVNDRDYFRDRSAQEITRGIAAGYDARALQDPVVVSPDGVVLSGNGRTMAGELAAYQGTDAAYIDYLREYCGNYGFTVGDVTVFAHPRVVFVLDNPLPYTVATFAIFNTQGMKGQSKTEQAIKFGRLVDDSTFGRIIATINAFETLSDFYGCTEAAVRCIGELHNCGVLSSMQQAEMMDGNSISLAGREVLENVLIGKAFANDPDAARMIAEYKNVRRSVIIALGEVSNNLVLGSDYSLQGELSEAISLCYQARKEGDYKDGERVSAFANQITIPFDGVGGTVADFRNSVVLLLADVLNDKKDSLLKKLLAVYNHQAKDAANGQTDMFSDGSGVKSKSEILADVKALFANGTTKEQKEAIEGAKEARLSENIFLTEEQLTKVVKGSYVEFRCKSGDIAVCVVEGVRKGIAYLSGKGGIKLWCGISSLVPTNDHNLSLPEWIKAGNVITDGVAHQRIAAVCDNSVIFEWLNGGYFDVNITAVLQNWTLSESDVCEIREAA